MSRRRRRRGATVEGKSIHVGQISQIISVTRIKSDPQRYEKCELEFKLKFVELSEHLKICNELSEHLKTSYVDYLDAYFQFSNCILIDFVRRLLTLGTTI